MTGKHSKTMLVTGALGYIGSQTRVFFNGKYDTVIGTDLNKSADSAILPCDITSAADTDKLIQTVKPSVVIHTAAISSVARHENNPGPMEKVNITGTENLVRALNKHAPEAVLVFLSSDYVFDGAKGGYTENDQPSPATVYGKTKAAAEKFVTEHAKRHIICRTAGVFGRGGNFFTFLTDCLIEKRSVDVYNDVFFTPTYIDYLLEALSSLLSLGYNGIIHIAGSERVSRYEFALKIAQALGVSQSLLKPAAQPSGGFLAKDSSLNSGMLRSILKNYCPSLRQALNLTFGSTLRPYFLHKDQRGAFTGVMQKYPCEEVNFVQSQKDCVRGGHYHKHTKELFFFISGKVRITLSGTSGKNVRSFTAGEGEIVSIEPGMIHTFDVIEDSQWINMLSSAMDSEPKDFYKV